MALLNGQAIEPVHLAHWGTISPAVFSFSCIFRRDSVMLSLWWWEEGKKRGKAFVVEIQEIFLKHSVWCQRWPPCVDRLKPWPAMSMAHSCNLVGIMRTLRIKVKELVVLLLQIERGICWDTITPVQQYNAFTLITIFRIRLEYWWLWSGSLEAVSAVDYCWGMVESVDWVSCAWMQLSDFTVPGYKRT